MAQPVIQVNPLASSGPAGYTPSQIRQAYGFDQLSYTGSGQTIAIVSAYNDPNITADLATFDSRLGLTQFVPPGGSGPSFTVKNPGARTTDSGWALETALDVEWAHAAAPGANILLVEAASSSLTDLFNAVSYAAKQPGVSVVSMSWGAPEFSGEWNYDSVFTTPGVTYVAASGDWGAGFGPDYPAISPNVLAVGGTTLTLSGSNNSGSETGWRYSGGGFSGYGSYWRFYEPEPSYQTAALRAVGLDYRLRTTPDVSFNADPSTGVSVYDSVPYNGQVGWFQVGGTSAAAPAWAGLIAIANQGLNLGGYKGTLSGTQALSDLYALSSLDKSAFHDITSGFNGYSATPGYDLVTGLGSPQVNRVIAGILFLNHVSESSALAQASAASTPQTTASRLDLTVSQATGAVSSGSSGTVGLPGSASILSLASSLPGRSLPASGTSILVFTPQTPATQSQPIAVQAITVHVDQALPPSIAPAQSLIQESGIPLLNTGISRPSELNGLTDEVSASSAQAPSSVEEAAPPALQTAPEAPAFEAPLPAPEAEPAPPADLPSVENFDLALAQLNMSFVGERLGSFSAACSVFDRASDASPLCKASVLAGTAAIAAAGYRLVLDRTDRVRRWWTRPV